MRDDGGEWYFCVRHRQAEPSDQCRDINRLGPYSTEAEAERAVELILRYEPHEWYGRYHEADRQRQYERQHQRQHDRHDQRQGQARPQRTRDRSRDDDPWDDGT